MDFGILISGLTGNIISGLSDQITGKINKQGLKKNIEKAFEEMSGKTDYADILSRLSFNENFRETIWEIGKGKIIDCNKLVESSLTISEAEKLNISKKQIIDALRTFSMDLFNIFTAKNAELGKTPAAIQNFFTSMDRFSVMPDCFSALLEEKIKDAGYADLKAKLRQVEKDYEELQASVAKRDKEDNLTPEIQKNLDACEFGEAEKLLLKSLDKHLDKSLPYTEKAAQDAFQLAKLKQIQLEYEKAKEYYKEAARLSPNNSLYLNALGYILQELGEYNKAIDYFNKALNIDLNTFGDNHPDTAIDYNNIGGAWKALGKYNKAIDYLQKAEKICMQFLGADHPNTKNTKLGIKLAKLKLLQKI